MRLTGPGSRPRAIVAALAVTQTVGYGSLWYPFPVFLGPAATDLHASRTAVTGAFTTAVLAAAALALPVGRWLDRHGSRALMTTGSQLGSGLLAAVAHVHDLRALHLVWTGIGAAGAMAFYEAAFATVIAWTPPARRPRPGPARRHRGRRVRQLDLPAADGCTGRPLRMADGSREPGRAGRRCHRPAARARPAPTSPPHPPSGRRPGYRPPSWGRHREPRQQAAPRSLRQAGHRWPFTDLHR